MVLYIVFLISFADKFCSVLLLTQHKEDLETNYWFHGKDLYDYRVTRTGIGTTAKYSVIKKLEQTLGFLSSCDRFN